MAIEVFNRYENKYLLDEQTTRLLQTRIAEHMELDAYNHEGQTYAISNLYFDTTDSQLIRNSLQKPSYKEKLRLRAYGVPRPDEQVYLEIKKKYRGLVNKRRSKIALADAYQFVASGQLPPELAYQNRQVLHEIAYMLQTHDLQPQLYLAYDRRAYFACHDRSLRISFDTNIRCRRTDLRLEAGDWGEALLDSGQWLMEIKVANNMPFWLARTLSELEVLPVSFSKYGTEYSQQLVDRTRQTKTIILPNRTPQAVSALRSIAN
jgi:SPX domain protein involved in polyphosphate accumulation